MKAILILMMAVLAMSGIVLAQEKPKITYYVSAGIAVPSAPDEFSDYWRTGLNIGGGVGFPISNNVQLVPTLSYSNCGFDVDRFLLDSGVGDFGYDINGGDASLTTLNADFRFSFNTAQGKVVPYVVGGAGIFWLSIDDALLSYQGYTIRVNGESETKVGIDFGAGIDFSAGPRTNISIGGRLVVGFTEGDNTQYFPLQVTFGFK
jgi:opacity protein-like surface antigen